jgi:hypothetical protein
VLHESAGASDDAAAELPPQQVGCEPGGDELLRLRPSESMDRWRGGGARRGAPPPVPALAAPGPARASLNPTVRVGLCDMN